MMVVMIVPHDNHHHRATSSGLDLQALLRYVCTDVFVRYDAWRYYKRSERWAIGLNVLRLFHTILSSPAFTGSCITFHMSVPFVIDA
jgi:hypothetical protein